MMRRVKFAGREFDLTLFLGMVSIMIVVITMTYIIADYQNRIKLQEVRVVYEEKIEFVTSQAKKFVDNMSMALTYLDTARDDLKNAKINLEKANFWFERKDYEKTKNFTFDAKFYFNRSNYVFKKALHYMLLSTNSSTEEYSVILELYINYTHSAINLTYYGNLMSWHLENASIYYQDGENAKASHEMDIFNELSPYYNQFDQEMENYMREIKFYYGIRE